MYAISPVTADTIDQVIELVLRVFTSDIADEMTAEGVDTFNTSSPAEQRKGLAEGQVFLAAVVGSDVIGVTRINDKGHLYLLSSMRSIRGGVSVNHCCGPGSGN